MNHQGQEKKKRVVIKSDSVVSDDCMTTENTSSTGEVVSYASAENSSAVIPSNATLPKKSSCSIDTQGALLQEPTHGPSCTWTRDDDALEYIAPNVDRESIPRDFRFLLQAVDMQVEILNFSSSSAIFSSDKQDCGAVARYSFSLAAVAFRGEGILPFDRRPHCKRSQPRRSNRLLVSDTDSGTNKESRKMKRWTAKERNIVFNPSRRTLPIITSRIVTSEPLWLFLVLSFNILLSNFVGTFCVGWLILETPGRLFRTSSICWKSQFELWVFVVFSSRESHWILKQVSCTEFGF